MLNYITIGKRKRRLYKTTIDIFKGYEFQLKKKEVIFIKEEFSVEEEIENYEQVVRMF